MALSYRTRKRLSLLILAVGLPLYIAAAVFVVSLFERPPVWLEFIVYVALGIVWALPLRAVFRGVGQPDPDARD
jgi:membrane protein implicated in regulation of membrane protease activity